MTAPVLSYTIVLMAYNQEDYVAEAVKALLAQDCSPVEILLSDDCSTDSTFDVMSEMVREYDGIHKVILNRNDQNLGVNRHINHCYELSAGEVIIATSGDDICLPHRARRTMEIFEKERPLLAFSHAQVTTLEGDALPPKYQNALFYSNLDPVAAAKSMSLYLGATCAWHKDLFRKYGPIKNEKCFEDLIFGFRAAIEKRVALIDEVLVIYRTGTGLSNKGFSPQSQAEYNAVRSVQLERDIAAFEQRLEDCKRFGKDATSKIVRVLEKRLEQRKLRQLYVVSGLRAAMSESASSFWLKIGAVLYERRKRIRKLRISRQ